jgi:hypothetical protein
MESSRGDRRSPLRLDDLRQRGQEASYLVIRSRAADRDSQ